MKLVKGAQARTTTGLRLREGPGTAYDTKAILKAGVLVRAIADPVDGWCEVEVNGRTLDGKTIYSEPDTTSSVEATRSGLAAGWEQITLTGFVGTGYLAVIDGPDATT